MNKRVVVLRIVARRMEVEVIKDQHSLLSMVHSLLKNLKLLQ